MSGDRGVSGDRRPGSQGGARDTGGATGATTVGWVLGFGSLVDPEDPLVHRMAVEGRAVLGTVEGLRRTWAAGLDNGAPEHDGKHHLDAAGDRPDVVVAALSADADPGTAMNVLALPVDADGLARTDARERGYERLEVSARFRPDRVAGGFALSEGAGGPAPGGGAGGPAPGGGAGLALTGGAGGPAPGGGACGPRLDPSAGAVAIEGPVWIYTATARTRALTADAAAAGRAVVSAAYVARVERAFAARGPEALAAYHGSTDNPPFPLMDLRLHWAGVRPGE